MFEMEDSKLGKLKVYNVTEARANFASVLREKDAKVVVTWHGRPSKVLVDYQEYSKLLQQHTDQNSVKTPSPSSSEKINPDTLSKLPAQWSEEDLSKIVKSITESVPTYK